MGHLREYYERMVALPESEWQFIASQFTREEFDKGQMVSRHNRVEQYLYFIETGIIRFFIPAEENEPTFHFSFDKEFAAAYDSFLTQTPSAYALQALDRTVCWKISHHNLQKVYSETRVGNLLGRLAAENLFLSKSRRELSLLNHSARERYLNLFVDRPELLKLVPLKYVASYIGITPQALSRIRRQIS